ncbi:MAG: TerC/Alx family metal homeostasis membrane protein [Saprospiraceae bacterium]|nr:TerC/Alx family metal homeostasis membrane protein [Saprospiraceae bacterium]HMW40455.1 TerC/Alx family metal homeostasis membrane protein [Saprospiraceae bacterium]HMX88593.1 TerC/Alx family metal homeostasis membrane protein [Saprospiraceae bacterium]HMZ40173.1 TerC/Alx family metal homeostasis membrane protein [Saprospiraceae bacterium]HNA65797.1 TerC/Alx family metal homeostasis membrane protein [Saprospiraceae bacterium]
MIAFFCYIAVIILAVFLDYRFFATDYTEGKKGMAYHSMVYWLCLTLMTMGFIYFAYSFHWFNGFQAHDLTMGPWTAISLFASGFLLEQSLSIDNIFVMAFLLRFFRVPSYAQNGLLSIGIWSAIVLRGVMIIAGLWLIDQIEWLIYVLGALLIYSGIKMYNTDPSEQADPNQSLIIRLIRSVFPVTKAYFGQHFIVRKMGRWALTPLLVTLVAIEFTDILFAIDSIPAIFALTTDPFLVLSSNILAVANLRALFSILSRILEKLEYIHYALSVLLIYIGVKILFTHQISIPEWLNLALIIVVLLTGTLYSLWRSSRDKSKATFPEQ